MSQVAVTVSHPAACVRAPSYRLDGDTSQTGRGPLVTDRCRQLVESSAPSSGRAAELRYSSLGLQRRTHRGFNPTSLGSYCYTYFDNTGQLRLLAHDWRSRNYNGVPENFRNITLKSVHFHVFWPFSSPAWDLIIVTAAQSMG